MSQARKMWWASLSDKERRDFISRREKLARLGRSKPRGAHLLKVSTWKDERALRRTLDILKK